MNPNYKPVHARAYTVPTLEEQQLHQSKEIVRLVDIGVLEEDYSSEWASPSFAIPKKNGTIRLVTNFRKLKLLLQHHPFPIPKIGDMIRSMEGFTFASALDLNMGYDHIKLDTDSQKPYKIVLPWHMGKHKYKQKRLPMGIKIALFLMVFKISCLNLSKIWHMQRQPYNPFDLSIITNNKEKFQRPSTEVRNRSSKTLNFWYILMPPNLSSLKKKLEYLGYWITR
jgi:hypothetical protein